MPILPGPTPDDAPAPSALDGLVIGVLAIVGIGGVADLLMDKPTSWWSAHILLEVALVLTSATLATFLWLRWRAVSTELRQTRRSLAEQQVERDAWRASAEGAIRSFGDAVTAQLTKWQLTPAEHEVALLLLQGLGHKEIAARTGRSERTVRQHAVSVYDKSGQSGRAELAGFFLNGLGGGSNGEP
ncbi:MAG: LuxR C-terminal-related transcriptional regulator [Gemmatimonadales bacterium]